MALSGINDRRLKQYLSGTITLDQLAAGLRGPEPYEVVDGEVREIPRDVYLARMAARRPTRKAAPDAGCGGVKARYEAARPDIVANGPDALRVLLEQTDALLTRMVDWSPCQKAARMRSILTYWDVARGRVPVAGVHRGRAKPAVAKAYPRPVMPPPWPTGGDIDLVVPLCAGSRHDDLELSFLLRSAAENMRGLRTVHLIGSRRPKWLARHPGIRWVQKAQVQPKNHDIIERFLTAAGDPEVSELFVASCDDWVFLRPVHMVAEAAAVQAGGVLSNNADGGAWKRAQAETRKLLEAAGLPVKWYDYHVPTVMSKVGWRKVDAEIPWRSVGGHAVWSLYHNVAGVHGPVVGSGAGGGWHSATSPVSEEDCTRTAAGLMFLNYNDTGFNPVLAGWLGREPWVVRKSEAELSAARDALSAGLPFPRQLPRQTGIRPPWSDTEVRIIPHIPYRPGRNLARAYNEFMAMMPDDPRLWVAFMDHDGMFLQDDWYDQCLQAVRRYPKAGLFTALCNRMSSTNCRCDLAPEGDDIAVHRMFALKWRDHIAGVSAKDITASTGSRATGIFLMTSKAAWRKVGGFRKEGFQGTDYDYHDRMRAHGLEVRRIDTLYLYHARWTTRIGGNSPDVGKELSLACLAKRDEAVSAITAVVTTHTDPRYLHWCVKAMLSVDAQSRQAAERFLVIDAPHEDPDLIPPYARKWGWTVLWHNSRNPAPGRQFASDTARCPWVAYLDGDDIMPAGWIEHMHKTLPSVPDDVGVLYGDVQYRGSKKGVRKHPEWAENNIWNNNIVSTNSLWRKDMMRDVLWLPDPHADWSLARRMADAGWVGQHHHGPPTIWVRHEGSLIEESKKALRE